MDRFKHLLVVVAGLVLAAGLSAVSAQTIGEADRDLLKDTIGENTAELEQLRSQIESNRKKLDNLENREAEFQRGHEEIQQDMELSSRLMGEMVQREIILMEQAELLKSELDASADVYRERKSSLAESLRAMYIRGETNELEALLTSKSFSDLVSRMEMGKTLARLQANLLQEVRVEGTRIQSEQRQLNASLAEIWQNREELLQENDRLEGLQAEHMGALRDLESTRKCVKSK
jgi:peptidoglycan hydrolase CwlO-like protein